MSDEILQKIAIWALPILLAITAHEAAHGWVAYRLGDDTAYRADRVTFNPLKHIDPIGTLLLPILLVWLSGFIFGWAKPVPVNFRQLRHPRRDMALVSLAGPAANLLMAIAWAIVAKLLPNTTFLHSMGSAGILINSALMVLNLLPILPLDGGRILYSLLPNTLAILFARLEPFGLIILLVLLTTGLLNTLLSPLIWNFMYFLLSLLEWLF